MNLFLELLSYLDVSDVGIMLREHIYQSDERVSQVLDRRRRD